MLGNFVSRVTSSPRPASAPRCRRAALCEPETAVTAARPAPPPMKASSRRSRCARPQELRAIWVIGNEYLQLRRALDRDQDRPGARRRNHPLRLQPDPALCGPCPARSCPTPRWRYSPPCASPPPLARRPAEALAAPDPATPSTSPTSSSPSSTTTAAPSSKAASPEPDMFPPASSTHCAPRRWPTRTAPGSMPT